MDWISIRQRAGELFGRFKYVLLVLAVGIFLMALPDGNSETTNIQPAETTSEAVSISDSLEEILSKMEGVGNVQVFLSESTGAETIYHQDEDSTVSSDSQSIRVETVIINGSDRGEYALVERIDPPCYRGAIVVCQGADDPAVRLQVVQAVSNVTGIGTDRIAVLKMK